MGNIVFQHPASGSPCAGLYAVLF